MESSIIIKNFHSQTDKLEVDITHCDTFYVVTLNSSILKAKPAERLMAKVTTKHPRLVGRCSQVQGEKFLDF
ncbi:MAG: hypothetical protein N0C90_21100, partial [Candidatus Thiodiazotropha endolucinida]|nr:hypothetical protein [Candidatus Thiodiazotropha taylori]MCW4263852.1 hypothetical protein [Candidatus Thiodiazotropha endolucinida]